MRPGCVAMVDVGNPVESVDKVVTWVAYAWRWTAARRQEYCAEQPAAARNVPLLLLRLPLVLPGPASARRTGGLDRVLV